MSANYRAITFGSSFLDTGVIPVEFINTITELHTVTTDDRYIVSDKLNNTITMEPSPAEGRMIIIKNVTNSRLSLDGNGNNIDGVSNISLPPGYNSMSLLFTGGQWVIL